MKVWGKDFQQLDGIDFELYLVDDITIYDEFVQIVEKNILRKVKKINKIVYTDGKIIVTSQREVLDGKFIEIKYSLSLSNWFLKYENNGIQLYVRSNYEGDIKTENKRVNKIINEQYERCRDSILSKKQFAKDMKKLALRLNLPFELVLSFRGCEEAIYNFIVSVEKAISDCFYADSKIMKNLISKSYEVRRETFEYMGLNVPETYLVKSFQIGEFVHSCLEKRTIVSNMNN